jgi:hypothetical protein
VTERADLRPSQIFLQNDWNPEPPPEALAGDPERVAVWHQQQVKNRQQQIASYDDRFNYSLTVFEVSGCGDTAFLGCDHPQNGYDADCDEGHAPVEIPAPN